MLKNLVRLLLTPDANTGGDSSTSQDDKGADSSQQQQDDKQTDDNDGSQQDNQQDDSAGDDSSNDTDGDKQTDDQDNSQQNDDGKDKGVDDANVVLDKPDDAKLPFHKHERFQEVIAQKAAAVRETEQLKPLAQQATVLNDYMRDNNISTQEFQSALVYLRNLKNDPAAAFAMLKPTYEQLAQLNGEVLPADLQAEVAAGTLPLERAKQIAKGQAQEGYQKARSQWQQQGQQQGSQAVVSQSTQLWVQTKQSIDPDLKEGTPIWKQTDLVLRSLPPANDAQTAMANCETAYKQAKEMLGSFRKAPFAAQGKRPPSSQQRSTNGNAVLKTDADVINAMKAGLRPNQVRYS